MSTNKAMGVFLIIIGCAAIIGGIVMLSGSASQQPAKVSNNVAAANTVSQPQKVEPIKTEPVRIEPTETEKTAQSSIAKEESPKPETSSKKEKGNDFEDFVVNLLADYRFVLLDRTQDAMSSAGVVAESCKNPDLHIKQKREGSDIDYYIECKYRRHWTDNAVTFEDWQLNRYRQFQRENRRKVIIALGVGGTAHAPSTLRLVPIDSIRNNQIRKIDTQFAVEPTPSALADYMNTYFSTVFKKSRNTKTQWRRNSSQ